MSYFKHCCTTKQKCEIICHKGTPLQSHPTEEKKILIHSNNHCVKENRTLNFHLETQKHDIAKFPFYISEKKKRVQHLNKAHSNYETWTFHQQVSTMGSNTKPVLFCVSFFCRSVKMKKMQQKWSREKDNPRNYPGY